MSEGIGRRRWLLAALLITLALWWSSGREVAPGVVSRDIGPCDLDWHSARGALVLACPGHEYVRLWPWPVVSPWWEDTDPAGGLRVSSRTTLALVETDVWERQ